MNSKSKHIGINGSMLDDHPTGVGIYSINVINQLTRLYEKSPNELTVFTPTHASLNEKLKVIRLPRFLKSSRFGRIAAFCRFIWNTFCYPFQARKFDVLLSPTTHGSFVLKDQILTIHDLISLRFDNISFHQRIYYKYLLPFLVSRSRKIVAVSENTKKDIIHYLKCPESKIQVIYNGYDSEMYNMANEPSGMILKQYGVSNYFLAIGPTYPHKNFALMIEAYAELPVHVKNKYPLVIAGGRKKYISSLKELVAGERLDRFVKFLDYIPAPLMPSLYKEAYLLIFPSLYEGFGFPLLEAMASGCPVIASDSSSIPEVCGFAALYFNPYNKEKLKYHINRMISNHTLYKNQVEKGLSQVKHFSWIKTAEGLKNIIEENYYPN